MSFKGPNWCCWSGHAPSGSFRKELVSLPFPASRTLFLAYLSSWHLSPVSSWISSNLSLLPSLCQPPFPWSCPLLQGSLWLHHIHLGNSGQPPHFNTLETITYTVSFAVKSTLTEIRVWTSLVAIIQPTTYTYWFEHLFTEKACINHFLISVKYKY